MFGQIDEIKNLAFKYSKEQLGRMAQMGMIEPQKAMMAGMMRDRVAKEDTKPPTTTVVQDVLPTQQMGMPQQAAPQEPTQMAATGGITSLPVQEQDYAGGGIVAFADGGDTDDGVAHFYDGGTTSPMGRWWKGMTGATPEQQAMYAAQQEQQAREQALLARQNELGGLFGLSQQTPEQQAEYEQIKQELIANRRGLNGLNATQKFPTATNPNAPVTGGLDTADNTTWIDATGQGSGKAGAGKAPAGGAGTGGGPRLPALNRPSGKIDIQEYSAATPKTIDEIIAEREATYKKQGIEDPYKGLSEKAEKKREELGGRKEQAKGEFLMNLGLGLTQASRGQELAGLGKGAMQGMAAYKDAMKDVRAAEEKLDERLDSYKLAKYQADKTGTDAAIAKRDSMLEKVDAAKNKTIEAKNAAKAKEAEIGAQLYGTETQANTARYVAQLHANTQKEMNTLVKQGQLDAKIAQVLLTSEKNFMDANAMSYVGKPDELARDARAHAMEAAKAYLPNSAAAKSVPAPAPAPTADLYKNKYGITPTGG